MAKSQYFVILDFIVLQNSYLATIGYKINHRNIKDAVNH